MSEYKIWNSKGIISKEMVKEFEARAKAGDGPVKIKQGKYMLMDQLITIPGNPANLIEFKEKLLDLLVKYRVFRVDAFLTHDLTEKEA